MLGSLKIWREIVKLTRFGLIPASPGLKIPRLTSMGRIFRIGFSALSGTRGRDIGTAQCGGGLFVAVGFAGEGENDAWDGLEVEHGHG